jgi:hypothetical protein
MKGRAVLGRLDLTVREHLRERIQRISDLGLTSVPGCSTSENKRVLWHPCAGEGGPWTGFGGFFQSRSGYNFLIKV